MDEISQLLQQYLQVNPQDKQKAISSALMNFGASMFQRTPYKRGLLESLVVGANQGRSAYQDMIQQSLGNQMQGFKLADMAQNRKVDQTLAQAKLDEAKSLNDYTGALRTEQTNKLKREQEESGRKQSETERRSYLASELINPERTPEEQAVIKSGLAGTEGGIDIIGKLQKSEASTDAQSPLNYEKWLKIHKLTDSPANQAQYRKLSQLDKKTESVQNYYGAGFDRRFGQKEADRVAGLKQSADDAVMTLETLREGKSLIDSGIYSGAAGEIKLGFDKWLQEAGVNVGGETASNTEAYASSMGRMVGKVIKQFGSGTGLSDADRDYAEKIAGGKITLTDKSIRKLLDINERLARFEIRRYNKEIGQARKARQTGDFYQTIEEPTPSTGKVGKYSFTVEK